MNKITSGLISSPLFIYLAVAQINLLELISESNCIYTLMYSVFATENFTQSKPPSIPS